MFGFSCGFRTGLDFWPDLIDAIFMTVMDVVMLKSCAPLSLNTEGGNLIPGLVMASRVAFGLIVGATSVNDDPLNFALAVPFCGAVVD
jgi:hypothetical protein